jgi:ribosomal protein L14E/L6E/L27E
MNSRNLEIGSFVLSLKGRDNKISIVYKILDNNYVLTVNGKDKTFLNPKRKNIKHLAILDFNNFLLADKIKSGSKILDAEIRSAIKQAEQNLNLGG